MDTQTISALDNGAILCPLDHPGLIEFNGEDAQAFLQGQLTNDIKLIDETRSQIAGYCTAKGRLLATLLLWKTPDGYCAQLHGDIAPGVQKKLSMYILRSKVRVSDAREKWSRTGLAGQVCEQVLGTHFGQLPQHAMDTVNLDGTTIIRLHGKTPRFELIASPEKAATLRASLSGSCVMADESTWDWLDIQAGVPQIGPGTQEEFVPQMVNLDLLDGISFKKGCYTGQEIVARTHYLGKVKRRTHLAHMDGTHAPAAGGEIYGIDSAEPVGMVINSAPAPGGGFDLLAGILLESVKDGALRFGAQNGTPLRLLELPYGF